MTSYMLGIDLGTSTVKAILLERMTGRICVESFKRLGRKTLVVEGVPGSCERTVDEILEALESCMRELEQSDLLCNVHAIGICGQMHGCVLWNDDFRFNWNAPPSSNKEPVSTSLCSDLITWQDGRCSSDFLSSLPKTQQPQPISTGYGCATLSWLKKYSPEFVQRFTRAGTIMDLVVWSLCTPKTGNPPDCEFESERGHEVIMSSQNATSWGYYDSQKMQWEIDL